MTADGFVDMLAPQSPLKTSLEKATPTNPSIDHRRTLWQSRSRSAGIRGVLGRSGGPAIWSAILLIATVLFGALMWLLTYTPQRTPVHLFVAAPYQWPLPPNAWSVEDIDKLCQLDGQTITLHGDDAPIFDAAQFIERFHQTLVDINGQRIGQPHLIVVSMHGVATSPDGPAYLIPPSASPIDTSQWISLDTLLELIEQQAPTRDVLVVLDCQKFLREWNIGLKRNHFIDAVEHALASRSLRRTRLLTTCSSHERAVAMPDLQGTLFGHWFAMGLGGAADADAQTGNQDGWVTVDELVAYTAANASRDAMTFGGTSQRPVLIADTKAASDESFAGGVRLARSMSDTQIDEWMRLAAETSRPAPWIAYSQLDDLWKRLDRFRESGLYQNDPIAFRDLEHQLLWLEQLAEAGRGYRDRCERTFEDASKRLLAADQRLESLGTQPSLIKSQAVLSGTPPQLAGPMQLHSLPLSRYFETIPQANIAVIQERLKTLATAPDAEQVRQAAAQLNDATPIELQSARFLRMVERYGSDRLWQRSDLLADLFEKQLTFRLLATPLSDGDRTTDHRTHAWTRQMFAPVDKARRDAEDCLFLTDCDDLQQALADAEAVTAPTVAAQREIDSAMRLCDTAMCEAAYLASWLMDPRRSGSRTDDMDAVRNTVLPLMRSSMELAHRLAAAERSGRNESEIRRTAEAIHQTAIDQVEHPLTQLRDTLANRRERFLLQGQTGQDVLGELEALLAVPLLDWQSRRDLRAAHRTLQQQLRQDASHSEPTAVVSSQPTSKANAAQVALPVHPLDLLLECGSSNPETRPEDLTTIAKFCDHLAEACRQAVARPTLQERRTEIAKQAARVRSAAPIWFPVAKEHALHQELRINLQCLLLWHAERTLDDFWGPAGSSVTFFDRACSDYLAAARAFQTAPNGAATAEHQDEVDALKARLAASRQSARHWIRTVAGPALQLERDEPAVASIAVMGESTSESFKPPVGRATVLVRSENDAVVAAKVQPSDALTVPVLGTQVNVVVAADDAATDTLTVQTVFRGHEYDGPLPLQPIGGYRVQSRPHAKTIADVTLNARREPLSVAFILDGSASMAKALDTAPGGPSRMNIAKDVLQESLMRLADRGDCRVAVRFFGHRIGWSTDRPVRPLPRPDLDPVATSRLRPSQDVEAVLRLSPLTPMTARRVMPSLQRVQPWGQSPLYLSLVQSLQDFRNVEGLRNTHVVVITDGANYQFIPPGQTSLAATTLDDVKNVWAEIPVPIHIFGLGIDQAEDIQAVSEFEQLCQQSGGRFHPLQQAADLKDTLSDLLGIGRYRIKCLDGRDKLRGTANLGSPIRVECRSDRPTLCHVQYESKRLPVQPSGDAAEASAMITEPVLVSGGQSLQLFVDEDSRSIQAYPFDQGVAATVPLVTNEGQTAGHIVRLHRPRQSASAGVTFPISWQRVDEASDDRTMRFRATAEPDSVWIEIQPSNAEGHPVGAPYVFYDADFLADQPVPLLELPAAGWPIQADRAAVKLWSRPVSPERLAGEGRVRLNAPATPDSVAAATSGSGLKMDFTLASLGATATPIVSGLQLSLERNDTDDGLKRLRFVVRGSESSPPITDYKLDVISEDGGRPQRIERRFDRRHHVAVHTFWIDPKNANGFGRVRVSDRDFQTRDAWTLRGGAATVPVVRASGLLRAAGLPRR